jgi:hypothetical protein
MAVGCKVWTPNRKKDVWRGHSCPRTRPAHDDVATGVPSRPGPSLARPPSGTARASALELPHGPKDCHLERSAFALTIRMMKQAAGLCRRNTRRVARALLPAYSPCTRRCSDGRPARPGPSLARPPSGTTRLQLLSLPHGPKDCHLQRSAFALTIRMMKQAAGLCRRKTRRVARALLPAYSLYTRRCRDGRPRPSGPELQLLSC